MVEEMEVVVENKANKNQLLFKSTSTRRYIKNKEGVVVAIGGWGSYRCQFCKQKVVAYNEKRHTNSQKHKKNIEVFERDNNVMVIENIDKIQNFTAIIHKFKNN